MFIVRPWEPADVAFLWEALYLSIHVPSGEPAPPRSIVDEPGLAHYLRDFGSQPGDDARVAVDDDGHPIGVAFCRRLPPDDPGYGYVAPHIPEVGMAVIAEHRGRGVGTRLLADLLQRHPTMSLSVDRDNERAHDLYRRLGFHDVGGDDNSVTMLRLAPDDMALLRPSPELLPAYVEALRRGWSPDTLTPEATARRHLDAIASDPAAFLATQDDPEALGPPIPQPDGTLGARLPGYHRWMWAGEFVGDINLRWVPGTPELPDYVLGHVGYSVAPWARGRGMATRALALLLHEARRSPHPTMVLPFVELTTDPDNTASQRVIAKNGGVLVEEFTTNAAHGARPSRRFRIDL